MSSTIEARLALLEDEREVLRTLHRYAHAVDYGDEDGWVDLFTDDGLFVSRTALDPAPVTRFAGHAELRGFIENHTRVPERLHKHMIVEPLIDVDGDTASATSYLFVLMEHEDQPVIRVLGRYVDRLRRCADGRWRFTERVAELDAFTKGLPALYGGRPAAA